MLCARSSTRWLEGSNCWPNVVPIPRATSALEIARWRHLRADYSRSASVLTQRSRNTTTEIHAATTTGTARIYEGVPPSNASPIAHTIDARIPARQSAPEVGFERLITWLHRRYPARRAIERMQGVPGG